MVPPSASSNRPMRSVRASVNAPFTWPNNSLSKGSLGQRAGVHRDQRTRGARRQRVQHLRDNFFAGAVLAGDQHVGIGRPNARDESAVPAAWTVRLR